MWAAMPRRESWSRVCRKLSMSKRCKLWSYRWILSLYARLAGKSVCPSIRPSIHPVPTRLSFMKKGHYESLDFVCVSVIRGGYTDVSIRAWAFNFQPNTAQIHRHSPAISDCHSSSVLPDQVGRPFGWDGVMSILRGGCVCGASGGELGLDQIWSYLIKQILSVWEHL